jgi:hypothetical protein
MRITWFAGLLAALIGPTFAQQMQSPLAHALEHVPGAAIDWSKPKLAYFVDAKAIARLVSSGHSYHEARRRFSGSDVRPVEALGQTDLANWNRSAGIDLSKVRFFVGLGQPSQAATIWVLETPHHVASTVLALKDLGLRQS